MSTGVDHRPRTAPQADARSAWSLPKEKKTSFAGILKYERSPLLYGFGGGCVFLGLLAGQLPVPRPMA
jgi:hypothetical protein